jgi:hypothetical protein
LRADGAQRIAEIETLWEHSGLSSTPERIYLASRDLNVASPWAFCRTCALARSNDRGGESPGGKLVASTTYILPMAQVAGQAAAATWRGPRLGIARHRVAAPVRFWRDHRLRGRGRRLSLVEAGAANVAAILGVGRLGKVFGLGRPQLLTLATTTLLDPRRQCVIAAPPTR